MQSPDSSSHTPADQGAQGASLRPESAAEKTGAVAKVPKSVSAGALSLMIPAGKLRNTHMHAERYAHEKTMIPVSLLKVEVCQSNYVSRITRAMDFEPMM